MNQVDFSRYDNSSYHPGRSFLTRALWHVVNVIFLQNSLNVSSSLKARLLRLFGAKVGRGVVLKPGINVKYPWHLEIGDHVWIGENVWLDSLAPIKIASHVCISQGAYMCTGNHNWSDPAFGLVVKPIILEQGVWIGARAVVLPGVVAFSHAVLTAGSVLSGDANPYTVYFGNPARAVKTRKIE